MILQPRFVAFVLALLIALANAAFCSLIPGTPGETIAVTFLISISSAFLLVYFTIEYLIFKELLKINRLFDKLKRKDFKLDKNALHSHLNPIRKLNDEISFFAAVKQKEIDDLKKMEAYRREFIADVSHELKTPIFAAQGFIHTLLDGAIDDPEVNQKFLKKAAKSLDGLDELVQDLLVLSEIETGSAKMNRTHTDVVLLIQEVFDQLEKKATKRAMALHLERNGDRPFIVNADKVRLFQVIQNLVENGIKYGHEGGWVTVKLYLNKDDIRIEVVDNGPGIPNEDLKRIFERFYRVEKSRSKEKGGSGLGLAIVKHILEAHKTKIKVKSEPGTGTVFWFKLPRIQSD